MAINATKNQGQQAPIIEEGAYPARIYSIIHIGTIEGFQGKKQNKARITFELPTELYVFKAESGEQPRVISQEYTLSFHEKARLHKVITACDPKGLKVDDDGFLEEYDIEKLLGKTCLVTIKHEQSKTSDAMYPVIDNCTVLPKGMVCPDQVNPNRVVNYDTFDEEYYNTLPQFLRDKMASSEEYKKMRGEPLDAVDSDTTPF